MKTARTILKIICLAGVIVGFTSSSWGVDRVKKSQDPQGSKEKVSQGDIGKEKTPPETKSQPPAIPDKKPRDESSTPVERKVEASEPEVQKSKKEEGIIKRVIKEDYDYFIDKNKNGIDDRLETKEKPKPTTKDLKSKKKTKPE